MAAKIGFFDYVAAAFNARPLGMFVAPNWVGLTALGLLGLSNPGFWVLGAGLELGYLLLLSTNSRFQRIVAARRLSGAHGEWDRRIQESLGRISEQDRRRYAAFADRCRSILELQVTGASSIPHGIEAQTDSLGRLSWMYLRLLVARDVISDVLGEDAGNLAERRAALQGQLDHKDIEPELRRSLDGQVDILTQRIDRRADAQRQLNYLEAELVRIEQQVELIREQAALSTDPDSLSQRIDEIAATLGGTAQWIRDQRQVYGAMEDLLTEPPPVTIGTRAKERQ